MIAPITNYSIAGAIWYQGENNTETANTYSKLFITLIDAWRKAWQKDFPFYYVQIAPFSYKKVNSGALLREAQLQSMSHPNTGMVATTDLVTDVNNVHPENKHDVGWRLANWALAETYGHKIHAYKSPVYTHVSFEKNKALITIANASAGMVIKGEKVNDIEIAGKDSIFYAAMATLKDNKIIAWSDSVKHPVALRYAFHDTSIGNVFNKDGLPLIPFRTDNWPIVTP
jgi:sialate O-acetylesterase